MDDPARDDLQGRLEELIGRRGARALMAEMTRAVSREELREELGTLEARLDAKLEALEARMDAKLARLETRILERMNEQTKTFVRTFYVTNAAMVVAVATLAFGAARIA